MSPSGRSGDREAFARRAHGTGRDPRSIVTPDAFMVSEALLGTPLAAPGRRFLAILVDLVVIGLVTIVTKSFALVLGVVAAVFFVRTGFKRIPVRGSVFGRAMRFSVGCLGLFIGLVTVIVWASLGFDLSPGGGLDRSQVLMSPSGPEPPQQVRVGLRTALRGAAIGTAFANADDADEAEAAAESIVELGGDLGLEADEIGELLRDLAPAGATWSGEADAIIARALEGTGAQAAAGPPAAASDTVPMAGRSEDALADPTADTVARLLDRIDELDAAVASTREDLADARLVFAGTRTNSLLGWLRDVVDDLGFGFGWATLYMTAILPWWNGRTVGKRLLGIRVVRLDGEPITWWTAFERVGGYAAGFATGLLGFAQVYWDANRQAIHDRIVGTVVVREGTDKVIDWESAL